MMLTSSEELQLFFKLIYDTAEEGGGKYNSFADLPVSGCHPFYVEAMHYGEVFFARRLRNMLQTINSKSEEEKASMPPELPSPPEPRQIKTGGY